MTNGSEILLQAALWDAMLIASGCRLMNGSKTVDGNNENSDIDPETVAAAPAAARTTTKN